MDWQKALSDYSQLLEGYPNAKRFAQALRGNIEQNVPSQADFESPEAMSQWSQSAALKAPMGLTTKTAHQLAHDLAQKNAVEMLGLPANNTAMDRAKALGFNVEGVHKTDADIDKFLKKYLGLNTIGNAASKNLENTSKLGHWFSSEGLPNNFPGNTSYPVLLKMENPDELSSTGALLSQLEELGLKGYKKKLDNSGHDSILINRDAETKDKSYVIRNNNQIRSRFAAFDPAKIKSSDILASLAPLAVLGYANKKDEDKQRYIDLLRGNQ